MIWEIGQTDTQSPSMISLVVHSLSSVGIVLLGSGKSMFWQSCVFHIAGFLFSLVPATIFNRFLYTQISKDSHGGRSTFFSGVLSLKSRSRLRLLLSSILLSLSTVLFIHGRSQSAVVNASVYSLLKVSVLVLTNGIRSSRFGRLTFMMCMMGSLLLITATSMKILWISLSFVCFFLAATYWKLLVPTFHNEKGAISAVLLGSSIISGILGLFIERFHFDFPFFKTVIAGVFTLSTPSLIVLMKKSSSTLETNCYYTFVPLLISSVCNMIGTKTDTPLVIYLSVIIAFIGCQSLDLSLHESVVFKPFATNRSGLGFIVSILVVATVISQYICSSTYGQIWRMGDAVYLIISLRWTLNDVIRTIQKSSSREFSYGHGRIRHLVVLILGISGIFSSFFVVSNCFMLTKAPIARPTVLSLVTHALLVCFFLWSPRTGLTRKASIRNAVNFSAGKNALHDQKPNKYDPLDLILFLLVLMGSFVHGFIIDRILALAFITIALYLTVPMIKESILVLLQHTSDTDSIRQMRSELRQCNCVLDIVRFNVWQNDDALSVASIMLKIDERVCNKPQDFLMYVISLCQQAGILDITVEIINRELVPWMSTTVGHNHFRNTPSPI